MSKITISEEKLNQLIYESIQESLEDEGLGRWLGNAYQWGRNKLANFRKDFEAGRRNQRLKNVNYDPLQYYADKYGQDYADRMRGMSAQNYANQRLNKMRNVWGVQDEPAAPEVGLQPNPDVAPQATGNGTGAAPAAAPAAAPSAPSPQAPTNNNQPSQNPTTRGNVKNKAQQMISKNANFLKQKGFTLQNGQWIYAQDGSNSPALNSQYPDIVQAAKSYNMAMKAAQGLYEQRIRKIVAESIKNMYNKVLKQNNKKARH